MHNYTIVQQHFLRYPYKKQVAIYALAKLQGMHRLTLHLQPCTLGSMFLSDVALYTACLNN